LINQFAFAAHARQEAGQFNNLGYNENTGFFTSSISKYGFRILRQTRLIALTATGSPIFPQKIAAFAYAINWQRRDAGNSFFA